MESSKHSLPAALTIAGSDSGGGAGIQADLKTFAALGVFGCSAITCVTAQNPDNVARIQEISPEMVALQIRSVCEAFPIKAAKIGMLYSAPVIRAVACEIALRKLPFIVVDPVMASSSGAPLLRPDAVGALCDRLLPLATLITPNRDEAAVLCGRALDSPADQEAAARELALRFGTAVVIKGGHFTGQKAEDVFFSEGRVTRLALPRLATRGTHGTGCVFSAALTAFLARGAAPASAFTQAKRFTREAIKRAARVGRHCVLNPAPPA